MSPTHTGYPPNVVLRHHGVLTGVKGFQQRRGPVARHDRHGRATVAVGGFRDVQELFVVAAMFEKGTEFFVRRLFHLNVNG